MSEMIPGTPIRLGGNQYIVPPLTFVQGQMLASQLERVIGSQSLAATEGAIDDCVEIIGTAMRRNYPNFTDDELLLLLDFGNYIPLIRAALSPPAPASIATFMLPSAGTLSN